MQFSEEINENGLLVYFKFDIRVNDEYWENKDKSTRTLAKRKEQNNQVLKSTELEGTKLVAISIHPSE